MLKRNVLHPSFAALGLAVLTVLVFAPLESQAQKIVRKTLCPIVSKSNYPVEIIPGTISPSYADTLADGEYERLIDISLRDVVGYSVYRSQIQTVTETKDRYGQVRSYWRTKDNRCWQRSVVTYDVLTQNRSERSGDEYITITNEDFRQLALDKCALYEQMVELLADAMTDYYQPNLGTIASVLTQGISDPVLELVSGFYDATDSQSVLERSSAITEAIKAAHDELDFILSLDHIKVMSWKEAWIDNPGDWLTMATISDETIEVECTKWIYEVPIGSTLVFDVEYLKQEEAFPALPVSSPEK